MYGAAVAAFISKEHRLRTPEEDLNIIEIGGGTGTLAADILVGYVHPRVCRSIASRQRAGEQVLLSVTQASLRVRDAELYSSMTYTSVEISESLAALQRARVARQCVHGSRFVVENRDAADPSSWTFSTKPTFFVLAEVLDNLPHDRYDRMMALVSESDVQCCFMLAASNGCCGGVAGYGANVATARGRRPSYSAPVMVSSVSWSDPSLTRKFHCA